MKRGTLGMISLGLALLMIVVVNPLAVRAQGYEQEINALSTKMAANIAKAGKSRVAVVDFTDLEGNVTALGRFIAEEFSVALLNVGQGFELMDRTHLQTLLKQHKLSATGLIDPATAQQLGKIAGVDALVTGTITPFGENVRLAVKILDANTAKLIGANSGNIPATEAIKVLLNQGLTTGDTSTTQPGTAVSKTTKLDGKWKCKWTSPTGYLYTCDMTVTVEDTTITGDITWTLKISPNIEEQSKIGFTAIELVKGSYNSENRVILLQGYEEDDPHGIIVLGGYKLELSKDGKILSGKTRNGGDWKAQFSATREN